MFIRFLFCVSLLRACVCGSASEKDEVQIQFSDLTDRTAEPVTITPAGGIRGSWMESRRGRRFEAYRGIRYAEPPIGELRFQPPVLIEQYKEEVNATEDGPMCPQPAQAGSYVDEDCLRINVYSPSNNRSKLLPVIFYIHPGGFYSVSGRSDIAGPLYLMDRDVVFVTINYRLGTLGFLSTGDELVPGNNGLKDQVIALRWVQKNIASFGGDPDLVTIVGYSAGSFSVLLHLVSPMTKGLFHRAVSMSGSPISQIAPRYNERRLAVRQAKLVNCTTSPMKALIECLKTVPWKQLGDSLDQMFEFGFDPVLLWVPVIEKDFGQEIYMPVNPLCAIQQKKFHAVPYIISQTRDEFFWKAFSVLDNNTLLTTMNDDWEHIAPISFQLPKKNSAAISDWFRHTYLDGNELKNDSFTADRLGKLYGDGVIGFGVHRLANLMSRRSSQPVFRYLFDYIGNNSHYINPDTGKPTGVAHHDDLIYLLSLPAGFPLIQADDTDDSRMVDKFTALFYNFARFGDPNPRNDTPELGKLHWPVMTPKDQKYLRIDKKFSVDRKLFTERYDIWDRLYPIRY